MSSSAQDGERPRVELFTDGACSGNPGPGGWAYILRFPAKGTEREDLGGERRTTNNRMELMAVIRGLESLKKPCVVDLYADSQYVVKGLNEWMAGWKAKGWKRGRQTLKNEELWRELDRLAGMHEIRARWVRGHANHPENERADQLATSAARRAAEGETSF